MREATDLPAPCRVCRDDRRERSRRSGCRRAREHRPGPARPDAPGLGGLTSAVACATCAPACRSSWSPLEGRSTSGCRGCPPVPMTITKPFSARELELRIRGVLRRALGVGPGVPALTELVDGGLRLDVVGRRVYDGEAEISCTAREFDLLLFLARNPGARCFRATTSCARWGWRSATRPRSPFTCAGCAKIEADPSRPVRLVTVFGRGYRWDRQFGCGRSARAGPVAEPARWAGGGPGRGGGPGWRVSRVPSWSRPA